MYLLHGFEFDVVGGFGGADSSFVPPLIYAVFGTSRDLAVGTVGASSLLAASIIGEKVSFVDDPQLYLHLFYTATFCTGVFEAAMGFFRFDFTYHHVFVACNKRREGGLRIGCAPFDLLCIGFCL